LRRLLTLLIILAGCSERAPPAPVAQNIRPAKIMTVEATQTREEFEFTARIEAAQSIDLSFEVGGPLATIAALEGATIAVDSLIAALDPRKFELDVSEARVQLRLASQDLERKQKLYQQNGISKSQVDDAQSNFELQQIRTSQARESLSDTRMISPFDGYVSRRYLDVGVNVHPGEPVVRLHDLTSLLVVISVPQDLVATATAKQVISSRVTFPFIEGQSFPMTYHENRGEADALTQTYEVTFIMQTPASWNILPGMAANAFVEISRSATEYLLVPASALIPTSDNGLAVWVLDPESSQVTLRAISTGAPLEAGVPVTAGLSSGEQIVIAGASQLQAGMQVRPLR